MSKPSDWVDEAVAELPPLSTVEEARALLRTSRRHFYRLVKSGKIEAVKAVEAGRSPLLIPRAEVARYLRSIRGRAA